MAQVQLSSLKRKVDIGNFTTLIGLIILCGVLTILTPQFLQQANIINVITQATVNAIVAIGITFVIITGGIDLSVGAIVALAGVVMGMMMKAGIPVVIAIIVCMSVGALCGFLNGIMITKGNLPPFIATLGSQMSIRGLALVLAGGMSISSFGKEFCWLGVGTIPGTKIPVQVLFMILLYILAYYILNYRKAGRYIYSIGGNEEATRLSGINIKKYKILAYTICGMTAGIATVFLTAKLNSAQPTAGYNYELDAIAATVIGGASLTGGYGKISGTLIGAVIIAVLRNGLNLMNVTSFVQQIVIGFVIIGAVLIDTLRKKA